MNLILKNWTFFRLLRLLMGILVIIQALMINDILFGIAGLIFTLMALFNQGCCGVNISCTTPTKKIEKEKEIEYEEVVK